MKCRFCKQPAGFMKGYHKECYESAESTMKQLERVVNEYKDYDVVPAKAKDEIIKVVSSNELYRNHLEYQIIDKKAIHTSEIVIHVEYGMTIRESKNRCKMVETGYRYEKKPVWNESNLILDKSGTVIFTDKAVYLYVGSQTMRYPYNKIVNIGFEKSWATVYAYFDVKTSSPFAHRFEISSYVKEKNSEKEQNICLFLHCLSGK